MIKISSSVLSANFAFLGDEVSRLCAAGSDFIHVDVMDGHFVPNITIGPDIVKSIKQFSTIPLDVHLMIDDVEFYAEQFVKAGADILTFHLESMKAKERSVFKNVNHSSIGAKKQDAAEVDFSKKYSKDLIKYVRSLGVKVGVSIVPATPSSTLKDVINEIDLVLIMTVNPGFAEQKFIHSQLEKISQVKDLIASTNRNIELSVDGGINSETAKLCINSGASILVSGSYIFSAQDRGYKERIESLRNSYL